MSPSVELERLYDEHAQALYAFLLHLTRSEPDTHDLLQDLFVKLARHPNLLNDIRNERAFLLQMAHHAAIDLSRRRQTRAQHYDELEAELATAIAPAADPDEQVFREVLSDALAELPPDQRAVVHLQLWEGLTFEEIAEALGVSPNTAASRYRYGIDKLRERLRPLYDETQ